VLKEKTHPKPSATKGGANQSTNLQQRPGAPTNIHAA
jgi:hypothetical protein